MDDTTSERFLAFLEVCDIRGGVLTARGWAFCPHAPLTEAIVTFEGAGYRDATRATIRLVRFDVGERIGPHALLSGFDAGGLVVVEPGALFLDLRSAAGDTERRRLGAFMADPVTGAPLWVAAGATQSETLKPFRAELSFAALAPARYAARSLSDFAEVPPPRRSGPPVSLLASIYKGPEFLDAFFLGLRERTAGHHEIILVDNGNTDAALSARIVAEAARVPRCRVIRRAVNEGYIQGIGAAFAARSIEGHVVVLNSDLELPPEWLPRLLWPLDNLPQVATATPFTNAGTSCSFPLPEVDNESFLGLDVITIDLAFQRLDPARMIVDIPSGVGFCMAMHAEAIRTVGWFDAQAFGFGYGEENDWCMRARAQGWRDLLVPNLFVYHKHGGIYAARTKHDLLRRNLATIAQRYPAYFDAVADYFATDPAAVARAVMAFRLGQAADGRPGRLVALHLGQDHRPAMTELAHGGPMLLVIFDEAGRTWSALLSAAGHRAQVWGWGKAEIAALASLLELGDGVAVD